MSTNNALGVAKDFTIFVFNDHIQSPSNCEGAVAVGNRATYIDFNLGTYLPIYSGISTTRNDLVVGNIVDITRGTNFSGNSVIQTLDDSAVINYTMINNNINPAQPNLQKLDCPDDDNCIDFITTEINLINLANNIEAYTDPVGESHIGTVEVTNPYYLQLELTGTNNDYNVFFIDYGQLLLDYPLNNSFHNFIINAPDDSSVIIVANYVTTSPSTKPISFTNGTISWNGVQLGNDHTDINNTTKNQHLFWCLPDCTDLNISGHQFAGTILAPIADSDFVSGQINGSVITQNLDASSGAQYGLYLYQGTLPIPVVEKAKVSGVMWDDFESDGILSPTDGLVPYASVLLLDQNNNVIATTITDSNGYYEFINIDPETYKLQFKLPESHINYNFVTTGGLVDSNGVTPTFTLISGEDKQNVNAPIHVGDFEIHKSVCTEKIISFLKDNVIYYEISFVNFSTSSISNLVITDTLNSNTSYNNDARIFIGATDMTNIPNFFTVTTEGSTINFNIANLAGSNAGYITFSVSLTEDFIPGNSIVNSATAIFNGTEVNSEQTVVRYEVVKISKYAPASVISGGKLTYTLAVANSSATETPITITDVLPPQFTLDGYTGGTQDVSNIITIKVGCLHIPEDPTIIPTLTNPDGGSIVTGFTATMDSNNTLTITNLSIAGSTYLDPSTIACLSGMLITIPGTATLI